ncbi:TRAP transporter small permease [Thermoanaerobacteraceae bacterium SP2]|nr:TRAP transporter small permease [Thermoanaerobacteraceae bacterium SP2]
MISNERTEKNIHINPLDMIEKHIVKVISAFLVPGFLLMNAVSLLQVIFRYILKKPLPWSEEMCRYLYVYTTYLGSVIAVSYNTHIEIDVIALLLDKLKTNTKFTAEKIIGLFKTGVLVAFLGWLSLLSFKYISEINSFGQKSAGLGINMAIPLSSVFVGCILMSVLYLKLLISNLCRTMPDKERGDING